MGEDVSRLDVEVATYASMTADQVEGLMDDLRRMVPMATVFGSAETTPKPIQYRSLQRLRGVTVTEFQPASAKEIEEYQQEAYPGWLSSCRLSLENLHTRLTAGAKRPEVEFLITNCGTRPASRALVRFLAQGNASIIPAGLADTDGISLEAPGIEKVGLPKPPSPPRGFWKETPKFGSNWSEFMADGRFPDPFDSSINHDLAALHRISVQQARDPDGFYWKGGKPYTAKSIIELTCENWRHGIAPEGFAFYVVGSNDEDTSAALRCEVHAENLTDPVISVLPVRIRRGAKSTFEHAQRLVDRMRVR